MVRLAAHNAVLRIVSRSSVDAIVWSHGVVVHCIAISGGTSYGQILRGGATTTEVKRA
jgi:hypothetical protein